MSPLIYPFVFDKNKVWDNLVTVQLCYTLYCNCSNPLFFHPVPHNTASTNHSWLVCLNIWTEYESWNGTVGIWKYHLFQCVKSGRWWNILRRYFLAGDASRIKTELELFGFIYSNHISFTWMYWDTVKYKIFLCVVPGLFWTLVFKE